MEKTDLILLGDFNKQDWDYLHSNPKEVYENLINAAERIFEEYRMRK